MNKKDIDKLNNEIFEIFELSEGKLSLNILDSRAWKIIWNDIQAELIPWEMNIENPILNICVGVCNTLKNWRSIAEAYRRVSSCSFNISSAALVILFEMYSRAS